MDSDTLHFFKKDVTSNVIQAELEYSKNNNIN